MPSDRTSRHVRPILYGFGIAVIIALVIAGSTSSTSFGIYNPRWNGAAELQNVGRETGATLDVIRDTSAYANEGAGQTLGIVLSPNTSYSTEETARISAFLRAGGTLLVADDDGATSNRLLAAIGANARLDGHLIRDERRYYRSPAMPLAANVSNHSVTDDIDQLTLNYGTAIHPNGARVLVSTSEFAYLDENRNGQLDSTESVKSYPVATIESVGSGQVIVVGDPSIVINVMLTRPGNRAFVRNLFETYPTVLLDYSHVTDIPPLSLALLILRSSTILQAVLGFAGIGLIIFWVEGGPHWLAGRYRNRKGVEAHSRHLEEAELQEFVTARHPDWNEDRVRRIVRGVISRRNDNQRND